MSLSALDPLLDQLAIAFQHTRLFADLRSAAANLNQTNRILSASHAIGRDIQTASSLEEIAEKLMISVGDAGFFRSMSFAVVDRDREIIQQLRTMNRKGAGSNYNVDTPPTDDVTQSLSLDSRDVLAEVARVGKPLTIERWDDRFINASPGSPLLAPSMFKDKVSYFIPIKHGGEVLAILGTASSIVQRPDVEARLDTIQPLFDQLAVALDHIRMVERLAGETKRLDSLTESRQSENQALLSISELVQEMSRIEDLEAVIRGISKRLAEQGFDFAGMMIHRVIDESKHLVESHHLRPDGDYRQWWRPRPDTVEEWRNGRIRHWPDIEKSPGSLGSGYYEKAYRAYGLKVHSLVTVPYRHGTISLRSTTKDAFSENQRDILTKVGNVLSVGISRLNDFERLNERRTEQEALVAIGRSVMGMRRPEDVESVLRAFSDEIRGCGVQVEAVTYHILRDPERQAVETYRILVDGPFTHQNRELPWVWERWRSQETHYVRRDDRVVHGLHIQSTLYTPQSHGLVTLRSTQPERFEEPVQILVRRLAEPLSLGFVRLNDLEQLERRASETAQERDFSESLIESLKEGLCILSHEGYLLYVNPSLCKMTGFEPSELLGSGPPHPFWPPDQSRRIRALMLRARHGDLRDYDVTLVRKDGTRFPAIVSPSVTKETKDRGAAYFATIPDVTEQREIQAERVHSQRLRVIGELSAGVSHNLNNILTSILGPAQLLELKTDDPKLLKDIEMIHHFRRPVRLT